MQSFSGVFGVVDFVDAVGKKCSGASHNDEPCDHVGEDTARDDVKLRALVLALDHYEPHNDGADGDSDVFGKPEQLKATGNTRKLAENVAEVDQQDGEHHEEGDAEAEFFADEIAESLAGDRAHAGGDFL